MLYTFVIDYKCNYKCKELLRILQKKDDSTQIWVRN